MSTRSRITAASALLAATVLLGACGTAKVEVQATADSLASDAASAALDRPIEVGGATTTTSPGGATTTAAPTSAAQTTSAPNGERSDEAFCAAGADLANSGFESLRNLDLIGTDRQQILDQLKSVLGDVDDAIAQMDRTAPAAIATDMHTLATEMSSLTRTIDADQDFGDLFDSLSTLDRATTTEAGKRVGTYLSEHCGFALQGTANR